MTQCTTVLGLETTLMVSPQSAELRCYVHKLQGGASPGVSSLLIYQFQQHPVGKIQFRTR
jgi:hypothetical protein